MANLDLSIRRIQILVGNNSLATHDQVISLYNSRHSSLLDSFDWSRKKGEIAITGVPDKSNGTLTLMNGSPTVNGTSTTFTASDVDKYVKIGPDSDSLFVVQAVNHSAQFTMSDLNGTPLPWPGPSMSGQSYVMFKRLYTLGAGIEMIFTVKSKQQLTKRTQDYIDSEDPTRECTSDDPLCWAPVERDRRGVADLMRIELWPRPTAPLMYTASVQYGHVDLLPNQSPIVPSDIVDWFALVDTCYMLAARTKYVNVWLPLAKEYITQAIDTLDRQRGKDQEKFGALDYVKDVYSGLPLGQTDFGVTHDTGDW